MTMDARKPDRNASPAPVVSCTSILNTGTRPLKVPPLLFLKM